MTWTNHNPWTPEQIEFLKAEYHNKSISELEALMGKDRRTIYTRAGILGLSKNYKGWAWKEIVGPFANLHQKRINASISRRLLGKKIGYHPVQIYKWEKGKHRPQPFALKCWIQGLEELCE